MIKIAVCEDEEIFKTYLIKLLENYFRDANKIYRLEQYACGELLLEDNHIAYDIIFLDIEIKGGMDGIAIAQEIRNKNNFSEIIFITSHQEEAYKAFEVAAFRYLLKPIDKDLFYKTLDLVITKMSSTQEHYIILKRGKDLIRLNQAEVLYIETEKRRLRVCTLQEVYLVDDRMSTVEKMFKPNTFFRIHKSYMINLSYIKEYTEDCVKLSNDTVFYISRLKITSFRKAFLNYLKEEGELLRNTF